MKNLKRALSFALASVMVIGMMVVGAGAANFTDAEKIVNEEAVNTLVALGVISGKEDGSYFDPTGTVTRGEMAKMITVALNGGKAPVIGTKTTPTYSDIKGHWAEAYIEYCSNLGIIAGKGDGTFAPNAVVTGTEAAKMMLVAMGWDATIFKFTGSEWALSVNTEANKIDMYDGLESIDVSAGLSRDNAALLIYNAILAPLMEKDPSMEITGGNITWQYGLNKNNSIFQEYFGGKVYIGTFIGNDDTLSSLEEGYIQVYGQLDDASNSELAANFPYDFDIANIGEEVKVLFKDGKAGVTGRPDVKDTVYGVFTTGATKVINVTRNDVKNGDDSPKADDEIKLGSTTYKVAAPANSTQIVTNNYGATSGVSTDTTATVAEAKAIFEGLKQAQSGDTIKFVTDADGKIIHAYVVDTYITYVTAVNSGKVTLNGVGSIKIADNDVYEGVAKNDIVTYTKFYNSDKDEAFFTVKKAETVSGELTGYKAGNNVVLDGTTYKLVDKTAMTSVTVDNETSVANGSDSLINETFTAYMVNGYVGYLFQTSDGATDYALVTALNTGKLGSTFDVPKVQLLLTDGTKVTVEVHEDSVLYTATNHGLTSQLAKGVAISTALEEGQLVKYSEISDGVFKLEEVGTYATTSGDTKVYTKDTKVFVNNVVSGDCPLFVKQGSDWKVYTLRSLNDITVANSTEYAYATKDGKIVAAYVQLAARPSGASDSQVYGVVSAYVGTVKVDKVAYNKYTVENNAETMSVLVGSSESLTVGTIVSFEKASDDIYSVANNEITTYTGTDYTSATKGLAAWVKEYNAADKTITYFQALSGNATDGYTGTSAITRSLDDDCVIVYLNMDDGEAGDDIGVSAFDGVTGYRNVLLVKDTSTDKVVAIIIESSGEAEIMGNQTGSAAGSALKSQADGVYVPTSIDATNLAGVEVTQLKDIRVLKYTSNGTTTTYTLSVKNAAGSEVLTEAYNCTDTSATAHTFYFNVKPATHGGSNTATGTYQSTDFAAGTYSFTITATDNTVALEGFFNV